LAHWKLLGAQCMHAPAFFFNPIVFTCRGKKTFGGPYHSAKSSGEVSVVATIRAPCDGGLDQRVRCTLSASFATMVKFPTRSSEKTPKFLEKDWAQKSSKPSETKKRTAQASLSREPEAKP
uniref:Uncharacterized protein n=1 Tax=Salvator merianae TaxID=96440 RepID=A0A8D0E9E4_SALMN